MITAPIDIVIEVLAESCTRLDVRTGEVRALPRQGRMPVAEAVGAALRAAPVKRGARVLVLSAEFFTQAVRLTALQTNGLSRDELLAALVFEVEPFSNIPHQQGVAECVAGEASGHVTTWQVLQIASAELNRLVAAVRAAGGRAAGFALADAQGADALERLRSAAEAAESPSPPFPVIVPPPTGAAAHRLAIAASVLFALAAVGCGAHYFRASERLRTVREQVAELDALEAINTRISAENQALRIKIGALQKARGDTAAVESAAAQHRGAWAALIRGLAEASTERVLIRQIESPAAFAADIEGTGVAEQDAGEYLTRLSRMVEPSGWRLSPRQVHGSGGPVRFRFSVSLQTDNYPSLREDAP